MSEESDCEDYDDDDETRNKAEVAQGKNQLLPRNSNQKGMIRVNRIRTMNRFRKRIRRKKNEKPKYRRFLFMPLYVTLNAIRGK